MKMATLAEILNNAIGGSDDVKRAAQLQLETAAAQNFGQFLLALVQELRDTSKTGTTQQLAGLVIKTSLTGQSEQVKQQKAEQFLAVDQNTKETIKRNLLEALVSPIQGARKSAASAVAALGLILLPVNQWPDLLDTLMKSAISENVTDELKVSILETIGYICEQLDPSTVTEADVNLVLTAVVYSMGSARSVELRIAGTNALLNTLEFATSNMNKEKERDEIIKMIKEGCISPELRVRKLTFECLARVATLYYGFLQPYMKDFYNLTCQAINQDDEEVVLNAIEFWSSICDEEMYLEDLKQHQDRAARKELIVEKVGYIEAAVNTLVPLIQQKCLLKQDDDPASGEWTVALAGGTCLGLIAQCVKDAIIEVSMPFVRDNIKAKGDWRRREAALVSFGSILDGPSSDALKPLVREGIAVFLNMLNPHEEENEHVRDTAAWAIGVICELHVRVVHDHIEAILSAVVRGLQDTPTVAGKNAFAIQNVARAFWEDEQQQVQLEQQQQLGHQQTHTNGISKYIQILIQKLIECGERRDAGEQRLRNDCYEAISSLVEASDDSVAEVVNDLLIFICKKLQHACEEMPKITTTKQREELDSVMMCCSQTLLAITQKIGSSNTSNGAPRIAMYGNDIILLCMAVLKTKNPVAGGDALIIIGYVADAIGPEFVRHMENFFPLLVQGLQHFQAESICKAAAIVVGDISRAISVSMLPFAETLVQLLLLNLTNPSIARACKPPTVSALGDIAHAIGDKFEPLLPKVMKILKEASDYAPTADYYEDEELVEYVNQLRDGILEAYIGIVQGIAGNVDEDPPQVLLAHRKAVAPYIQGICGFVAAVAIESNAHPGMVQDSVIKGCIGVLGDMIRLCGSELKNAIVATPTFVNLIRSGMTHPDEDIVEIARWTNSLLS